MTDFDRAMAFVLKWEGGYVNHPDDPGGETKYGISKRAYPALDIPNLTRDEAVEIYRRDYWNKSGCDALLWPYNLVHFDTSVNMGVGKAQGFHTHAKGDWHDYLMYREVLYVQYANKPSNLKFLKGWISRVLDLYATCRGQSPEHPISMEY